MTRLPVTNEHKPQHWFRIAGIPLHVRFLPQSEMPMSQLLLAFQATSAAERVHPTPIIVEFISEAPNLQIYQERLSLQPLSPIHMALQGEHLLFTCPIGQFLCNHDFARIWLWSPHEKALSPVFDGYPWLQLILWGRLSVAGGCYLHGAIVALDGHYVLMLGDSGVGKSTLSGLAVQKGYTRLTEENPFLTWQDDRPWVHAAPWPGTSGPPMPVSGTLSAVFFLRHAPDNTLRKLSLPEAGRRLLSNARMFNWLPSTIPGAVELLDKTLSQVPVYDFGFIPEISAIEAIRSVL